MSIIQRFFIALAFSLSSASLYSRAEIINFETDPTGAVPIDDAVLADPYPINGGTVRFFFDTNGNSRFNAGIDTLPRFEDYGSDGGTELPINTGFFSGTTGEWDFAAPGFAGQLGNWFLRQPIGLGAVANPFIIQYDTTSPITAMSGEIWDIDGTPELGTEQWLVEVLNASGTVIASSLSPLGESIASGFESKPWNFAFTGLSENADRMRITFVGTKTQGLGLAFNNFSPAIAVGIPEPSSLLLAVASLLTSVCRRRRKAARPPLKQLGLD